MAKFDLKTISTNTKNYYAKNEAQIKMGVALGSLLFAGIYGIKQTPKALELITNETYRKRRSYYDEKVKENESLRYDHAFGDEVDSMELSKIEIVKSCWKCYAPSVLAAVFGTYCLYGSNKSYKKQLLALSTACNWYSTNYFKARNGLTKAQETIDAYKSSVKNIVGEKKAEAIKKDIVKKDLKTKKEENNVQKNKNIILASDDSSILFYEPVSKQLFSSTMNAVNAAVNELNYELTNGLSLGVEFNDWLDALGIDTYDWGSHLGWDTNNGLIDIHFDSTLDEKTQKPAVVIEYDNEPRYDFNRHNY